jgi:prepilin-type N-terminal cleavage/methylation domain-containing protein/prepilin-type processing-associated H-X9-DG protein
MFMRRRRRCRGFTLVELLVVIGIIALLVGILLPVLNKVRAAGVQTKCATNLRTLAQGWYLYQETNLGVSCPGRMPRVGTSGGDGVFDLGEGEHYRPRWYELLGATMKKYPTKKWNKIEDDSWTIESELFKCGAVPDWNNSRNYPYGYNYQFLGNARKRPDGKWINWPVKASTIKASQTVMAMDCMGTAAGSGLNDRTAYLADGTKDPRAQGNKGWAVDPPWLPSGSDYADPEKRTPQHRSGPDARHNKRVNVAFCDGRVQSMTYEELGYVVKPDGSLAADNTTQSHNRLFSGTGNNDAPPKVN